MLSREDYVYVGVDLHKAANVAMMVDCFGDPVGKSSMKFDNVRTAFGPWVEQVKRRAKGKAWGWRSRHSCWKPGRPSSM